MDVWFYAPFKPLGHRNPSGDLVIATGLHDFLRQRGHGIRTASGFRMRWITRQPWRWPAMVREGFDVKRNMCSHPGDVWLTYHSYYKAPDLFGPPLTAATKTPYVIFQGIYSTKQRRSLKTWLGFYLNRRALCAADHVFTNKKTDLANLRRILPDERLTFVAPGIRPASFRFDAESRNRWRRRLGVEETPLILSAAMFRRDVKTQGLVWLIQTLGEMAKSGSRFALAIAGDGPEKSMVKKIGREYLGAAIHFAGRLTREEMAGFYSAGDLFAYPGIKESLGMVYLEAQSCGLPVVAFDNGGIPEAVVRGETGFLTKMYDTAEWMSAVNRLLEDHRLRKKMGEAAETYIRRSHDLEINYGVIEEVLSRVVEEKRPGREARGKGLGKTAI